MLTYFFNKYKFVCITINGMIFIKELIYYFSLAMSYVKDLVTI